MATEKAPSIIDLTEIVQDTDDKGRQLKTDPTLSEHVSDLMSDAPDDDIDLDDLLAKLSDGTEKINSSEHPVNPDEKLKMPGMDDMDAVLDKFDKTVPDNDADTDLDDLLSDLDNSAAKQTRKESAGNKKSDKPTSAPGTGDKAEELDLDDLLAGLEPVAGPAKNAAARSASNSEIDDLDALLDAELRGNTKQVKKSRESQQIKKASVDFSAMQEQLNSMSTSLQNILNEEDSSQEKIKSLEDTLNSIKTEIADFGTRLKSLEAAQASQQGTAPNSAMIATIMKAMQPGIEKSAAAAAAAVIREEIMGMFAGQKGS